MTKRTVYGYHNKKTHVLWDGYDEMLDMMSNESHPDNQGRLQTLGNDPEHGQLDWDCITDKSQWESLVKQHGAEQGFTLPSKAANQEISKAPGTRQKPARKTVNKKPEQGQQAA